MNERVDVALQTARPEMDSQLIQERMTPVPAGNYASRQYLASEPPPRPSQDLAKHSTITMTAVRGGTAVPRRLWLPLVLICALCAPLALAERDAVKTVASGRLTVSVENGSGQLALDTEADLSTPQPSITRAIVVFHGLQRNAGGYLHDVEEARTKAGAAGSNTLLLAPQFLDEDDARAYKLPADVLRWHRSRWEAGEPATRPAPISSYDAIDAILQRLSVRTLFPNLREIVLAGHSGG